jgi:hypothetical protein
MKKLLFVFYFLQFSLVCSDVVEHYYQEQHIVAVSNDSVLMIGNFWSSNDLSKRPSIAIVYAKEIEKYSGHAGVISLQAREPLQCGGAWALTCGVTIVITSIAENRVEVNLMPHGKNVLKVYNNILKISDLK